MILVCKKSYKNLDFEIKINKKYNCKFNVISNNSFSVIGDTGTSMTFISRKFIDTIPVITDYFYTLEEYRKLKMKTLISK